ncbi:MAG: response regulator transcription factor [Bacilli bacterium]
MEQDRILVVDDEERIRRLVRMYLERANFDVDEADNGTEGLAMALDVNYALIVLDLMLPGMDGRDVCSELRQYKDTPVIVLTAAGDESNRVHGFEVGADDYVVKPFSPRELVMRVKALLRRSGAPQNEPQQSTLNHILSFPGLVINVDARKVLVENTEISLTPKEFELLLYLAQRPEKVFSREELLRDVWNYQFFGDQRTVDTHVKRLREKLGRASDRVPQHIHTVWGVGYKFEVAE